MNNNRVIQKSISWSLVSEIMAKLFTPITSMLLARLLTPEDFGVVAICNMVVTFSDIVKDSGFGKYIIQNDFKHNYEKDNYSNVAFWTNIIVSVIIFFLIIINKEYLGYLTGNAKYSLAITVASVQILITAFSSIHTNLLRRDFQFNNLFRARILIAILPLLVTVPLAIYLKNYWAIIVGNLIGSIINALYLSTMSTWRPKVFYSFSILKKMFSFSFWSLCEGLAHWLIFWVDVFILTSFYNEYYVGLYKNSSNMVISIMGMISASISPVLLSVLSRLKNDNTRFFLAFSEIHRILMYLVLPMGFGLFCYRNIITIILFGNKWIEAKDVVGAWGLMMMLSIAFYTFTAEIYKSKGIPRVLFLFQVSYLLFMIPICYISLSASFWNFVYSRCASVLIQVALSLMYLKCFLNYNGSVLLRNFQRPIQASAIIVLSYITYTYFFENNLKIEFAFMILSGFSYALVVYKFFYTDLMNSKIKLETIEVNSNSIR